MKSMNPYFQQLLVIVFAMLSILFTNCDRNSSLTQPEYSSEKSLEKDGLRIPDVPVYGYVYKDGKGAKYATVKLLDGSGTELTSTTANALGYYSMIICPYGFGSRTVEATYSGETGTNHFTYVYGTWSYNVDVTIGSHPDSGDN